MHAHTTYTHTHTNEHTCTHTHTAACYDSRNHCVWTANDDWVDIWDCAGRVRVAVHHLATRLGKSSVDELLPPLRADAKTIHVSEAIALMLRHIGIESYRLVPGYEFSSTVVHHLPLVFLQQCCDLLEASIGEGNWGDAQPIIITLQVYMSDCVMVEPLVCSSVPHCTDEAQFDRNNCIQLR